jgi:ATP-dependent protease Clp ATPase subunit
MRPMLKQAVAALTSRRKLRCSFCGRDADSVARLVAGASGYICDACITACVEVLRDHGGFEPPGQTRPHQLPTR